MVLNFEMQYGIVCSADHPIRMLMAAKKEVCAFRYRPPSAQTNEQSQQRYYFFRRNRHTVKLDNICS